MKSYKALVNQNVESFTAYFKARWVFLFEDVCIDYSIFTEVLKLFYMNLQM